MTEKKYKVVGRNPIRGRDRKYVPHGEVVTLDPDDTEPGATNVQALIDGGHIEEVKSSGGSTSSTAKSDDKGDKGK